MSLWDNPMVTSAIKAMDKEQLEKYKKMGEYMYGSINFEDSKIINSVEPPLSESVAYIEQGIRSGLLPSDLTEDEIVVLDNAYGEKWYENYGFTKDQIPEYGLSARLKESVDKFINQKAAEYKEKKTK